MPLNTEAALIDALRHSEAIAEQTLATLAAITLARIPVAAVALATGEVIPVEADRLVVIAEARLFDALVSQLRDVKAVAADLVAQLSEAKGGAGDRPVTVPPGPTE